MIKNYTSEVPANRSVARIEDLLVRAGAKTVIKMAEAGKITGIAFVITLDGQDVPFRLPARVDKVEAFLRSTLKRPRSDTLRRLSAQAERTAWKILSEWIEIQLSIIELNQAEFIEVFLPYVYDQFKDRTYFEKVKDNGYKLLLEHKA